MPQGVTGVSLPQFWLGLMLMYLFCYVFNLLPSSGYGDGSLTHLILPAVTLGAGYVALLARTTRAAVIEILSADYIRTARSKGLKESRVIGKHAVPNALHPIIMYQGMVLPYMLQGEMEAAIVLSLPTMGPMFYDSLINQDIYVAGSFLLILAVVLVIGNLLADILLAALDPRIRYR